MLKKNTLYTWVATLLVTLELFMLEEVGLKVASSYGFEQVFKLIHMGDWSTLITVLRFVKIAAAVCGLIIALSMTERGKIWYTPFAVAGTAGLLGMLWLAAMKEQAIAASGLESLMGVLSVECVMNEAVWLFAGTSMVELLCGMIPFLKKK